MRRPRDADGIDRADGDPFRPNESDARTEPQAARTLPAATLSRWLFPQRLHRRVVSVSVWTPAATFERGEPIPVRIELRNPMPFPVTVRTRSPFRGRGTSTATETRRTWRNRSRTRRRDSRLDRGERRRFQRSWSQSFQTSDTTWKPANRGEHTIGAGLTVSDPADSGLYDETTVRIE